MVGLKTVTYAKVLPKIMNPRDIAGECGRRRRTVKLKQALTPDNCTLWSRLAEKLCEMTFRILLLGALPLEDSVAVGVLGGSFISAI